MAFAERIKALKNEKGWTNQQLAEKANLPVDTVSKLCSGATQNPNMDTLARLASAFGCTPNDLFGFTSAPAAAPVSPQVDQSKAENADTRFQSNLKAMLDSLVLSHARELEEAKTDKKRWFMLCLLLLVFLLFLLTWDVTHPAMGYIQY